MQKGGKNSPFLNSKIKGRLKENERVKRKDKEDLLGTLGNDDLGWRFYAQENYAQEVCSAERELKKRGCKKWYGKSGEAIYKDKSI